MSFFFRGFVKARFFYGGSVYRGRGGGDLFAVFKWAAIKGRAVIAAVKRHETLREKRGKSAATSMEAEERHADSPPRVLTRATSRGRGRFMRELIVPAEM